VQLLRVVAVILFLCAWLAGVGWGFHWDVDTLLGVIASGLAAFAASFIVIPAPPSR
jgi:F0F1-type ATP synthase assembly protein I